jgi:vancomycin resistance protein YoaR
MSNRVELPIVTETEVEKKHVSLLLIADGLKQAETNLAEQENNIRKLTDQINQLQAMRVASMAQRNLLADLQQKITELEDNSDLE